MKTQSDPISLFNETARSGTKILDKIILEGKYYRGSLFLKTLKKYVSPNSSLLDYGCGSGRMALMMAREGHKVRGMDHSIRLIEEALALDKNGCDISFSLSTGNGEQLPSECFHAIVCSSVIEFVPDVALLLSNFNKALKPGGFLIISFSNRASIWRYYAKLRFGSKYKHFGAQQNSWTKSAFTTLVSQSGRFEKMELVFFESVLDKWPLVAWLNRSSFIGTLGLLVMKKPDTNE